MGMSLYSMFVPSGFGGRERDGLDVNTNCIFTQGVLAVIILVALGQEMKRLWLDSGMTWFFLSGAYHCPIRGKDRFQIVGAEALRAGSKLAPFPLCVCSSSQKGAMLGQEELV